MLHGSMRDADDFFQPDLARLREVLTSWDERHEDFGMCGEPTQSVLSQVLEEENWEDWDWVIAYPDPDPAQAHIEFGDFIMITMDLPPYTVSLQADLNRFGLAYEALQQQHGTGEKGYEPSRDEVLALFATLGQAVEE